MFLRPISPADACGILRVIEVLYQLPAGFYRDYLYDFVTAYSDKLIYHIDCNANMVRDYANDVADIGFVIAMAQVKKTMLFGKLVNTCARVFEYAAVAIQTTTVGGQCFGAGVKDAPLWSGSADNTCLLYTSDAADE